MQPKRYRLLVVDDERDNLLLFQLALNKHASIKELKTLLDGRDALSYLHSCCEQANATALLPALIILDLKMPGMNGFEVMQQLKADTLIGRIPIVIFTASREEEDIVRSYALGASSFIHKDIDFDTFCEQLEYIINYWLEVNQPPY